MLTEVKTGLEGRSSESGSSGAREPTHGLRPASLKTPHSGVFPALGPPTKPAGANQVLFPALYQLFVIFRQSKTAESAFLHISSHSLADESSYTATA